MVECVGDRPPSCYVDVADVRYSTNVYQVHPSYSDYDNALICDHHL